MKSAQVSATKYQSMRYNFPFREWINGINGGTQVLPIFCILFNTMRISNQPHRQRKWKIKTFNQWLHSAANVHIAIIFMRQSVHENNNSNIWTENTNSFFIGLSTEHSTVYRVQSLIIIYQLKIQDWIRISVNKIRKMLFYLERNMRQGNIPHSIFWIAKHSHLYSLSHSPKHLSILKLVSSFDI